MSGRSIAPNKKLKTKICRLHFGRVAPSVYTMSESDRSATTSLESISAELDTATPSCPDPTRRALILTALAAGIAASKPAAAAGQDQPRSHHRPQNTNVLPFSSADYAAQL